MSNNDKLKETLEALAYMLNCIVDYPVNVTIKEVTDDKGTFIQVHVDKRDMGQVVGRNGAHIEAIKLIAKLVAYKSGIKVSIKLDEPLK